MKLYIFRHGQTDANVQDLYHGITDACGLNEKGREQARVLRDKLAAENLPVIFSSPLKRTRETAEIVAGLNNARIEIVETLHEMNAGDAEGLPGDDARKKYERILKIMFDPKHPEFMDIKFPNGESSRQMLARFNDSIDYIKKHYHGEKAGIATHGGLLRAVYYHLFNEGKDFENCEYFVLEV